MYEDKKVVALPASTDSLGTSESNPKVYFDISIGGEEVGRIVFVLFEDVVPKT